MDEENVRYNAVDSDGEEIVSTFLTRDHDILKQISKESEIVGLKRCGLMTKNGITLHVISENQSHIASSRVFKKDVVAFAIVINSVKSELKEQRENIVRSTKRFVHNVVSLNAKNIQEIHSIVPQERVSGAINQHLEVVKGSISEDLQAAALATLKVAKNNAAIKVEIAVFNKLIDSNPNLTKRKHNAHKVFMNVYYMFSSDFTDRSIRVEINATEICEAYFDYESVQVALYHLLDNAVKYAMRDSKLVVSIFAKEDRVFVTLEMTSLKIENTEKDQIFEEGYSGTIPTQLKTSGDGLGMYIAKRLLRLNNSELLVETESTDTIPVMGVPYNRNKFCLILPLAYSNT